MASTPNQVATSASAYLGFSQRQFWAAAIYLLAQIAKNTMTPNQIAVASACFNCTDEKFMLAEMVYLLNQIQAAGGGGGSGNPNGTVDPNGVTTGTAVGQIYFNTAADKQWVFQGTVGQNTGWVQYI